MFARQMEHALHHSVQIYAHLAVYVAFSVEQLNAVSSKKGRLRALLMFRPLQQVFCRLRAITWRNTAQWIRTEAHIVKGRSDEQCYEAVEEKFHTEMRAATSLPSQSTKQELVKMPATSSALHVAIALSHQRNGRHEHGSFLSGQNVAQPLAIMLRKLMKWLRTVGFSSSANPKSSNTICSFSCNSPFSCKPSLHHPVTLANPTTSVWQA